LAEESTSGAQQAVQEKAQQAKEQAQQATSSAKEQVQQATSSAQDKMREQVDTRSTEAGHQVDSVAEAMRKASEHLSGQGNELPAKVAEQAAQRAEQLGRIRLGAPEEEGIAAQPGEKGDAAPRPVDAIEAQQDADGKGNAGSAAGKEEHQREPTRRQ
jgi:predicted phage tail protein